MPLTITEALAEIKTIGKRIAKKRESIYGYVARQDAVRDPLEKDGGSAQFIANERQSIGDLEARLIALRDGIAAANETTFVTINGVTMTISQWLTWRREIASGQQTFLGRLRSGVQAVREQAKRQGVGVVNPGGSSDKPQDFIININERDLASEIERHEDTLGQLDGLLSLKNATVMIDE